MIQATDLFRKVMRMWGNPSVQELSPQVLRDAFERVFHYVSMQMATGSTSLSGTVSQPFQIGGDRMGTIPYSIAASNIISVECSTSHAVTDDDWVSLPIGVAENWNFYKDNSEPTAIFLNNSSGYKQIKVNFDPQSTMFRIFYINDTSIDGQVDLPQFFTPMFEYGMATEVTIIPSDSSVDIKDFINSKSDMYMQKYSMYLQELERWVKKANTKQGVSYRTALNASRKYGNTRNN